MKRGYVIRTANPSSYGSLQAGMEGEAWFNRRSLGGGMYDIPHSFHQGQFVDFIITVKELPNIIKRLSKCQDGTHCMGLRYETCLP